MLWAGRLPAYQGTTVSDGGKITGADKFVGKAPLPRKGMVIKKRLRRRAGLVTVKCDAYNWMSAVIKTFDHPCFSVTDERGAFEITDVPPGKYKLTA